MRAISQLEQNTNESDIKSNKGIQKIQKLKEVIFHPLFQSVLDVVFFQKNLCTLPFRLMDENTNNNKKIYGKFTLDTLVS